MILETLREHLQQQPFEPFAIRTSSGQAYRVANPDLIVLMKSKAFVAEPNSDRATTISYLHITAIESGVNGHRRTPRRRK